MTTLTPAIAGLSGAGIGSAATILGVWVSQGLSARRERSHRTWERRAAAYEDILVSMARLRGERREATSTGELRLARLANPDAEDAARLAAQAGLYGSVELRTAQKTAFDALTKWLMALMAWRSYHKTYGTLPDSPPQRGSDALWDAVLEAGDAADKADLALTAQVRADALGERPKRFLRSAR
ncbi:hypothetical protein [Yinghuangia seranimata]|uniref:hypothetical protein n=1 Tax=Yinghuangia seranimata TaxID=408067 RepID=UPI00248BE7E1|nr:hypothetical protein [Yinghuangia seranimata]MDI2132118.1 hypothetical protein [Yinghuangia seranimata]